MYRLIIQKVALGAMGGSSSLIFAKSLKWMRTLAPKSRSYMTIGRGALAFGREVKHVSGSSDYLLLGAPASSNLMRGRGVIRMLSRQFSYFNELPAEEAFLIMNGLKCGKPRDLPSPPAIDFDTTEGELLLSESSQEGNSKSLLQLMGVYEAMSVPGLYGLASISTVLNALEVTSKKKMKRRFRSCFEFLLDSCDPFEKVQAEGLTIGKLAFVAHCEGAKVDVFQANQCTIDDFRKYVMKCATSKDYYMVAYYDRSHFNQIGGSHFAPIGAYHAGRDLVFVLDVSRFEYHPFWIPLTLLWKAMSSIDGVTGHHMGFMVLSRIPHDLCILYTLSCRDESWISTANHLNQLSLLLRSEDVKDIEKILEIIFASSSTNFGDFIKKVVKAKNAKGSCSDLSRVERERVTVQEQLLREVQETELYKHVSKWFDSEKSYCRRFSSFGNTYGSPEISVNVDCHGLEHSGSTLHSSSRLYSTDSAKLLNANDKLLSMEMSQPVLACSSEQGAGPIVPSTHPRSSDSISNNGHLAESDDLTMLLFALPPNAWSGINEAKISTEFKTLVSIENLPPLLKNEVLSLRQQLHLLMIDLGSHPT